MYDILDLIPQRDPIVMVDGFSGIDNNISVTYLEVKSNNIFLYDNMLTECGLIEHIAQSAAARVGYICLSNGEDIKLGYIGSINKFCIERNPQIGETVKTYIHVVQEVFNITLIEAHCFVNADEIASCQMKIFLNEDETQ